MLVTAARAAVFHETVSAGAPELPLTVEATGRLLVERSPADATAVEEGLGRYREFALRRTAPPRAAVEALRDVVERMPAYLDPFRDPPRLLPVEQ
jgi:hypothetical protein